MYIFSRTSCCFCGPSLRFAVMLSTCCAMTILPGRLAYHVALAPLVSQVAAKPVACQVGKFRRKMCGPELPATCRPEPSPTDSRRVPDPACTPCPPAGCHATDSARCRPIRVAPNRARLGHGALLSYPPPAANSVHGKVSPRPRYPLRFGYFSPAPVGVVWPCAMSPTWYL